MSQRWWLILGALVLIGISSGASILIYTTVVGGTGEPSAPISAPTLDLSTPTPDPREAEIARLSTEVARLAAENAALSTAAAVEAAATVELAATEEATSEVTATPEAAAVLFRIVPDESEVRFILTEDLRGAPTTVIGKTDQVAGEILVDFATPGSTRMGVIRINARTLATDNDFRNRAIRGEILQSSQDKYEFSEFTPTELIGLPETVAVGDTISFQIIGDLKVRDITQTVTFEATVTVVSEDRLEGSAKTTVQRADYDLVIPSVPGVANVSEAVNLEIDFVAARADA
ncbi:MAG: YceI family protein [Chloroflexi bacterium]|nr:YceI family protein [Chloroflexota bacterium]